MVISGRLDLGSASAVAKAPAKPFRRVRVASESIAEQEARRVLAGYAATHELCRDRDPVR